MTGKELPLIDGDVLSLSDDRKPITVRFVVERIR
jgi:hypothetical protein